MGRQGLHDHATLYPCRLSHHGAGVTSTAISLSDAIEDPALFQPWFTGPSWDGWRAVLKASEGLRLSDSELTFFRSVAERDPPTRRVRELWIIAGRRAGKDSIASAIAAHAGRYSISSTGCDQASAL
jgi:hypothetical protein